jgi:hypothetical protein
MGSPHLSIPCVVSLQERAAVLVLPQIPRAEAAAVVPVAFAVPLVSARVVPIAVARVVASSLESLAITVVGRGR